MRVNFTNIETLVFEKKVECIECTFLVSREITVARNDNSCSYPVRCDYRGTSIRLYDFFVIFYLFS